ncbi:MAG: hypothetical protein CGU29_12560 [Candidatus Dactylopiibacterium carminicum]|uniref:Tetratricopeptide repeat protein n=1 Tax=Candidatus Dactylopiibacterium carminicum TaxID=857335 RepID=A0A272EQ49_9RHOO|nr:tetratricopeptide repeat protein [Candidatus Dactylopiibacterium carminicum]KAF7598452.1 hypothetical protein BGI27_13135 [Candidatus Dactylopiibacterium carminicum]PAS92218.1 MAG: hypothetical protein CGU29_12560 [Candidatus Dactylopiibacterium carminicum]PAS97771.1 MAG: hypothetical protein BSR46_13155 [Candidatus Dactylopiibacterium carminicum]
MKPSSVRVISLLLLSLFAVTAQAAPAASAKRKPAVDRVETLSSAQLLQQMFLAEVALARGLLADADVLYGEMIKRSDDERIIRRGNDIALANVARALEAAPVDAEQALRERLQRSQASRALMLMQLPALYARQADKQGALHAVERLTQPYLDEAEALVARALIRREAGELAQAMKDAQTALDLRPDWELAMLLRLRLAPDSARAELLPELYSFVRRNPKALEARVTYIRWLMEAKRTGEAREAYLGLLFDERGNNDLALTIASLAAQNEDMLTARSVLQGLVNENAGDVDQMRLLLGQVNEELKLEDEALQAYRAVTPGAQYANARTRLARLLASRGQWQEAVASLREAADQLPAAASSLQLTEAALLREVGQREQAYQLIAQILAREPGNETALYDGALLAEQLGQPELMEARLRQLLQRRPDHAHALNALGYSLTDRNIRLDEAQQLLEQAIALQPEDPAIIDSLGWLRFRQGRLDEALELLQRAYTVFPDPEVASHLIEVLWAQGRKDEARQRWLDSLRLQPDSAQLQDLGRRLGL